MVADAPRGMGPLKKKMLICGATGFIGRNCAEFFAAQGRYEVYGTYWRSDPVPHDTIQFVSADLTEKCDVRRAVEGMDIVIQAAATTSGARDIVNSPCTHVTDNAVMNALLFRAAFELGVSHLVFFSCTTMYGSSSRPVKETDFDANAPMYEGYFGGAWTKVYNEKMCEFYASQGSTRFTVARHSNIYGPYDKYDLERSHVFGATITKVETLPEGEALVIWGDGTQGRDLLHVSDLTRFVDAALTRQESAFELFNVGCGRIIEVKDLVAKIIQHSGKRLHVEHDLKKPTVNTSLCLDSSRAKDLLGWQPRVSLDDGIQGTLVWYRQNATVANLC